MFDLKLYLICLHRRLPIRRINSLPVSIACETAQGGLVLLKQWSGI